MNTVFIAVRALLSAAVFFWLWGWIALTIHRRYDAVYGLTLPGWSAMAAIPVVVAGCVLAFACVATFVVHGRGTPAPIDPPREFVAVGPYKFIRNPMYIGGAIILAGFGLFERSGAMVLFCIPFLLFFHLFVIFYEEPALRRKFGAKYEQYLRNVPRWVPRPMAAKTSGGRG